MRVFCVGINLYPQPILFSIFPLFFNFTGLGIYLWYTYKSLKDKYDNSDTELSSDRDNIKFYLWASIVWTVMGVRSLFIIFFKRVFLKKKKTKTKTNTHVCV